MTRAMKNSGVEWIGQIPESWNTIRLKMIAPILRGASPRPINDPKYFDDNGNYYWVRINDVTKSNGYLYSCAQKLSNIGAELSVKLEPNTLFISICATLGKPCITKIPCCIHDGFIYFYRLDKRLNKYLYYVFEAGKCFEGLAKLGTQQNLNTFLIGNIKIALPYNHKQIQAIANYLDDKCAQIDNITATINEQIEVLKQYKKSVITEAVTKGLDHNVPMKDSGVEWIGKIPEHWTLKPFEFILKERSLKNNPILTDERLALSIDKGITLYSEKTTNLDRFKDDVSLYKVVYPGDFVMNSMNMIVGAVGITPYLGCVSPAYYVFYDENTEHTKARFCDYIFRSKTIRKYFFSIGKGIMAIERGDDRVNTCRLKVSRYDLNKLKIPQPPYIEQTQIVNYLDDKCTKIDAVIADKHAQLETLAAYKKSLIYEYVTGKKSVPGFEEA